jgi:hypothetical protein
MKIRSTTHSARRVIAVTALCASLVGATGCFGSFVMTQRLYHWNLTVDNNKFARWGVFVATVVVPVYPSATIFDLVFTNSVEFWSGRNPMASNEGAANDGAARSMHSESGEDVSMRMRDDGAIDVAIRAPSQPDTRWVVVREGDSVAAYDEHGALVARGVELPEAAH